ncbi:MAG: DHHW family protein [Lachnospiraceae bacterium]|jgi:hypothetical protein
MKKEKVAKGLKAAGLLAVFLTSLFWMQGLVEAEKEKTEQKTFSNNSQISGYNQYGLEGDRKLADTILYEDEELVCYPDRFFYHFTCSEEQIQMISKAAEAMGRRFSWINQIYILPVPPRAVLEKDCEEDRETFQAYMQSMEQELAGKEKVRLINVLPELEEHREEYVFFRTEGCWTARGAYYGTNAFLNEQGKSGIPLSDYQEYQYNSFLGADYVKINSQLSGGLENMPSDTVFYYMLPGASNRMRVLKQDKDGNPVELSEPFLSQTRGGTSTLMDWNLYHGILEGDGGEETGSLLFIGDVNGGAMLSFLRPYYNKIYIVNIRRERGLFENMESLRREYGIRDVLIAQSAGEMGIRSYSRTINELIDWEGQTGS